MCVECFLTEQMVVLDCTGKVPLANLGQVIHNTDRICSLIFSTDKSCSLVRKMSEVKSRELQWVIYRENLSSLD